MQGFFCFKYSAECFLNKQNVEVVLHSEVSLLIMQRRKANVVAEKKYHSYKINKACYS